MIRMKRSIELLLVFSNSLLVGVIIGVIFLSILFPIYFLISSIKTDIGWSSVEIIWLGLLMTIGSGIILTIRFLVETKGKSTDKNRYKRVHCRLYRLLGNFTEEELMELLIKNGYQEIKMERDGLVKVVMARYHWGVFNFPKEYGGLRKFEDKNLRIIIDPSVKILKVYMGPKKWFIPTSVTHTNYYFLDRLESILQKKFKLEILESIVPQE